MWGYLWYIHAMLIVFVAYMIIFKIFGDSRNFWMTVIFLALICSAVHAIPRFYEFGYFRAFSSISLGMLLTRIPKIEPKNNVLSIIGFSISAIFVLRMLLFNFSYYEDELLNVIFYPSLVYFEFNLEYSNKLFNYFGSLSFGLYIYQSIPRLLENFGYTNLWFSFLTIVICTVITDLVIRLVRHYKQKNILV